MIYFIAPYYKPFLGASQKIESLIRILLKNGEKVLLVNTFSETEKPEILFSEFYDNENFSYFNINILNVSRNLLAIKADVVYKHLESEFGKPDLIWLYNGYFSESLLSIHVKKRTNCKIILEFEDWHFARKRKFNIKPFLDYFGWRLLMPKVDYVFAVNNVLAEYTKNYNAEVSLLPGLIANRLLTNNNIRIPFSEGNPINIGYFGGISAEKGGDVILSLAKTLPAEYQFIITGVGNMQTHFVEMGKQFPERFHYHGKIDTEKLYDLILSCDVLLNPHLSIEHMSNGVFPFKVMEAIASKRLLISSNLPTKGFEHLLTGIHFVGYDVNEWHNALTNSKEIYEVKRQEISDSCLLAESLYGETAIGEELKAIVKKMV